MNRKALQASLRLWQRRHAYRQRKLDFAHKRNDQVAIDKWHALLTKAGKMMARRRAQLAPDPPLRLRAYAVAESLIGVMEQGGNNVGPMVSRIIREDGGTGPEAWCFAAGTLVTTPDGLRPIEAIKAGDEVVTASGDVAPVLRTGTREAETVKLSAYGPSATIASVDHPYRVRRNTGRPGHPVLSDPEWIPLGEVKPRDYICLPALTGGSEPFNVTSAYVFGRFLADGWTVTKLQRVTQVHRAVFLCCAHGEADEVRRRLSTAGMLGAERDYPTVTQFQMPVEALPFWEAGGKALTKRVPGCVLGWNDEARASCLQGYLEGDGHRVKGGWTANTVSRALAYGIAELARSVGKHASVYTYPRKSTDSVVMGREVKVAPVRYELRITEAGRAGESMRESEWAPVRSITPAGSREVFNLTVAGEPTFIADGAAVHNCGDFQAYCYRHAGSHSVSRPWASVRLLGQLIGIKRTTHPLRGNLVRFTFDHVGMFDKDNGDGTITTIEGNTGASGAVSDSSTGGDGVYRKIRDKSLVQDYLSIGR